MSTTKIESVEEILKRRTQEVLAREPELNQILLNPDLHAKLNSPNMSLERIIDCVFECYTDRQALAERQYVVEKDENNNQYIRHYFSNFKSITYNNLHLRVKSLANVWKSNQTYRLSPGDFVCFIGTTGIDHVTVEFSLIYNQVGIVPLASSSNHHELEEIIQQIKPKAIVTNPKDLALAVTIARKCKTVKFIVTINFDERVTDEGLSYEQAQTELKQHHTKIHLVNLNQLMSSDVKATWEFLPANPQADQRIVRILYTSGSTGTPKGAIYTEKHEKNTWVIKFYPSPVIIVLIAPFNHLMGRSTLIATLVRGGIGYFPSKNDLSSIFEDIRLVRPTCLCLFPRFCGFIYDYYQNQINRLINIGKDNLDSIRNKVKQEIGTSFLGNRMIIMEISGAPVAAQIKEFMAECFDISFIFSYASTESGSVIISNDYLYRNYVKDYKLKDVPELDYFNTDKPYPRGELCIKTVTAIQQYYNNPVATENLIDKNGFIHTGDIVEDRGNDHVIVIDRMKDVIKLSQGEFVALGKLATLFESQSRIIHQMYLYGNSHYSYLLAVIVPDRRVIQEIFGNDYDALELKKLIRSELQHVAHQAKIKSFEIPKDYLIEMEPFTEENGLLSSLHKRLNKAFMKKYGDRLEALYKSLEQHYRQDKVMAKHFNSRKDVLDQFLELIKLNLKSQDIDGSKQLTYAQLGGDSLNAVGLAMASNEHFGIHLSADILLSPTGSIQIWVDKIVQLLKDKQKRERNFETIHGQNAKTIKAKDLSLNRFLENRILERAKMNSYADSTKTVLLTGANGFLGRFICLEWLRKLASRGGKLICLVRASSHEEAIRRIDQVFKGGDKALELEYITLKENTLEVIVGDISQAYFGLDEVDYQLLAEKVDRVVHAAAMVSHILSYQHLFTTNVVGTAEVIRFALTHINKPIDYISSIAIEPCLENSGKLNEDSALKNEINLNEHYAFGYAASKWASEHLLRNTSSQFGLSINIFRNNMMLAHQIYQGQINPRDFFTRLLYSIIVTGLAPQSFYISKTKPGHYDGLPVNIASSCIVAGGDTYHNECHTFTMHNYNVNDGCSLDAFVDWMVQAGFPIHIVPDYHQWYKKFKLKLQQLDEPKKQNSILLLLHALTNPQNPEEALSGCENFKGLIKTINPPMLLPHLNEAFILKCIDDITVRLDI